MVTVAGTRCKDTPQETRWQAQLLTGSARTVHLFDCLLHASAVFYSDRKSSAGACQATLTVGTSHTHLCM